MKLMNEKDNGLLSFAMLMEGLGKPETFQWDLNNEICCNFFGENEDGRIWKIVGSIMSRNIP